MKVISLDRVRRLIENGKSKTASDGICPVCYGTGMELVEGNGARRCACRIPALIAERLSKIPPRYEAANLMTLAARPDMHPKQTTAVEFLKMNPTESYVFCGKPDTGKTHLFWSLYWYAAQDLNRRVVACTMLQLINEYRDAFRPRKDDELVPNVCVRPNDLMQSHTPYSLFFDDIDKPKMSEYVSEQVHALFDAAYIYKHQIVVTTNLSADRLVEHYERSDDRYGRAIVRRIIHAENNLIEMF